MVRVRKVGPFLGWMINLYVPAGAVTKYFPVLFEYHPQWNWSNETRAPLIGDPEESNR